MTHQALAAIRFAPLLPLWLLAALAAFCVAALLPAAWRRARAWGWRAACLAVMLLWLAGPRAITETRQGLSDIALLVVDQTASMRIGHRARLAEQAAADIQAQAARIPGLELRTVTVPERGTRGTQLFAAEQAALADIPARRLAGVVAITDGMVHDAPASLPPDAPLADAPLHVLIAARAEQTDRRLRIIEAPSYGIVGQTATLKLAIDDLGPIAHPPATARLTLRRDGEPAISQDLPVGKPVSIPVPITRAGPIVLDLRADALPGEVSPVNNRAVVTINGVRDRLRVLLISGEPHSGERTWRRLLKSDPAVDLVHFTILRPPEKDDLTPLNELALIAFPVHELFQVKIHEFDLIILDRFQNRGLLPLAYLRNIADYVRDGGALLLSAGPEFAGGTSLAATPLGAVLPASPAGEDAVIDGRFRPRVTALGARDPVTENLPGANDPAMPGSRPSWGSWYRRIAPADVHGEVLMSSPGGDPLLILNRVGKGRTALLLSDQIWLWSRGHQGGGPQAELLRRIAHWTMKEPELEENTLHATIADGRLHLDQRTILPASPDVTVTDPDGHDSHVSLATVSPGHATADVAAASPGVWRATDGERTAYAAAGLGNPIEFADLRATATVLAPLARPTGGGVHWLDQGPADQAEPTASVPVLRAVEPGATAQGGDWIGLRRRHDHLVTGIAATALLPAWAALPLILALAALAWWREGASR